MKWWQNAKVLGLNVKKIKTSLIILIVLALGISTYCIIVQQYVYLALTLGVLFIIIFGFYFYVEQAIKEKRRLNDSEFAVIFTYFRVYSQHGRNVYQALQLCLNHASLTMKPVLENLIVNIENDTSIRPFLEFARCFSHPLIEEIAIAMYQMIDTGRNERYLWQFNYLFNKYDTLVSEQNHERKTRRIERLNLSALLGAAVLVLALAMGIIRMIGGLMNGF
ncbi:MAG: hypothetical protein ACOX3K_00210 [Bacilli bacterium]|jgi:ABC-type Fe3+-siderophore transport system permease subunit